VFVSHFKCRIALILITTLVAVPLFGRVQPPEAPEPNAKLVQLSTEKAVTWLKGQQKNGNWEIKSLLRPDPYTGGVTFLAIAGLLEAGVPADDPVITKAMPNVRKMAPRDTYVVALQTLVLAKVDPKKDLPLLKRNVEWFKQVLRRDGMGNLQGWGYPIGAGGQPDNSNTQFAVLALHTADRAGAEVDERLWKEIRQMYIRTQLQTGGWQYRYLSGAPDRLTMTSAGLCGLLITGEHLNDKDNATERALGNALERVNETFTVDYPRWRFYNLWSLARRGRLLGKTEFKPRTAANYDWYKEGTQYLLQNQNKDGSWQGDVAVDGHPVIATSFALLFLGKGR
jgi:hypothetical protein